METVIAAVISAVAAIAVSTITNISARNKEMQQIQLQIAEIKAGYQQATAVIEERIDNLTDHVNKHNNVVERTYKLESLAVRYEEVYKNLEKRLEAVENK